MFFLEHKKQTNKKKMQGCHSPGQNKSICKNAAISEQFLFLDQNRHLCPFSTPRGVRGVLSIMAYTGRLHPKGVGISRAEVYERVGKSVI